MNIYKNLAAYLIIGILFTSCQKEIPPTTNGTGQLSIISISPTSGVAGTLITIKGTRFKANALADTVKFNGTLATVQSASDTALSVLAPTGGTKGAVTVTTSDGTAIGQVFTYSTNPSGDVYIVGFVNDSSLQTTAAGTIWKINSIATYWKNGVAFRLSDSTKISDAISVAFSGNDMYVGGLEGNFSVFWKNGVPVHVNDGTHSASAPAIATSGSDFYMASTNYIENNSFFSDDRYWKNGVGAQLPRLNSNNNPSRTTAITVVGNDVYVAGYEANKSNSYDPRTNIAKYWKNGIPVAITNGMKNATTTGITVSNNDIYVSGQEAYEQSSIALTVAKYWKNGIAVTLTDGSLNGVANAIAVSGNDVYVVGTEGYGTNFVAKCWKNGVATILATGRGTTETNATSIFIAGKDVYISGCNKNVATYWKNGVAYKLPGLNINSFSSYAYGILVK